MRPPLRTRKLANATPEGRAGAAASIPCIVCFNCSGLTPVAATRRPARRGLGAGSRLPPPPRVHRSPCSPFPPNPLGQAQRLHKLRAPGAALAHERELVIADLDFVPVQ